MKIILDSDMLLFRVTSATEVEMELEADVWIRHSELPEAREAYWTAVDQWCDIYGCTLDDVVHCFTDRSTFRKRLDPGYKANRKGKPKPLGYGALKNQLLQEAGAWLHREIEADDLIGIFATMPDLQKEGVVIASGDKDLLQIAGEHIWFDTGKEPDEEPGLYVAYRDGCVIKTNTTQHAERFTYQQYLSGDSTDGIPGCPGLGAVGAKRIAKDLPITEPVDCWETIVRTYEEAQRKKKLDLYNAPQFATQQARLVRILRHGEYDFITHEVSLWNPPTR